MYNDMMKKLKEFLADKFGIYKKWQPIWTAINTLTYH